MAGSVRARLSRRVPAGFHGSGGVVLLAGRGTCWSAAVRQYFEPGQGLGDHTTPWPVVGEAEDAPAAGGDQPGGGGEQSSGGTGRGSSRRGLPVRASIGIQASRSRGDLDDLQPDLVLRHVAEREVAHAGGADVVFGAGVPAVTQLQRGDTPAARRNVSTPMRSLCSWNGCRVAHRSATPGSLALWKPICFPVWKQIGFRPVCSP